MVDKLAVGQVNPLNAELNPIRQLLALVGARHVVHASGIGVNLRLLRFSPFSITPTALHTHLHLHDTFTRQTNERRLQKKKEKKKRVLSDIGEH